MPRERTPAEAVEEAWRGHPTTGHRDERFFGWGLMGQPFRSGHVLALRCFPRSSVGPGYNAVWHRDPAGSWRFYSDVRPAQSCARYFGPALVGAEQRAICLHWATPWILVVEVPAIGLRWVSEFEQTRATRALNAVSSRIRETWFWHPATLRLLGGVASWVLGLGRLRLAGVAPSGQEYLASPRQLWAVAECGAGLGEEDFGAAGALREQARLGEFWLPRRSVLAVGAVRFAPFNARRHAVVPQIGASAAGAPP